MAMVPKDELEMFQKANLQDEEIEKREILFSERANQKSLFRRIVALSKPYSVFWMGFFGQMIVGGTLPLFGIFFSKYLGATTYPKWAWAFKPMDPTKTYNDWVNDEVNKWVFCCLGLGGIHLIFGVMAKFSFGFLSENVTLRIRKEIYAAVLRKHIGWFDHQENSPTILTGLMSEDTSLINGVAADSISVNVEGFFSLMCGTGIAFYYCWEIALTTIICIPILGVGMYLQSAFLKAARDSQKNSQTESDLLAGDAIINYRTVASFANDEAIVRKYESLLQEQLLDVHVNNFKAGIAFGFS